jgi:hypothetical protein
VGRDTFTVTAMFVRLYTIWETVVIRLLRKHNVELWTGFIWLKIGSCNRLV